MRTALITLAFVLAVALFGLASSWHQGRVDATVGEATQALRDEAALRQVAGLQWEAQLAEQTLRTLECMGQWRDAQQDNADLRAAQAAADFQREIERRDWSRRWAERPQTCDAGLIEMERLCEPALGRIE